MSNDLRFRATMDDKVSSGLDKMKDKFDQLGKSKGAQSILGGVGLAVGQQAFNLLGEAVGKVTDYVGGAITKASDLNETIQKSGVVFGGAAGDVEAWGKTAAASFGLSENAAIAAAASIGNLLLSTGTAPAKVAPMSKSIVQLAADLASFNNIPIEDALAKLQSGLVGQERPLRELGVAISAASVDAEALVLGFKKVNGTFTEGEKVQARYALIFQQTSTAQGDFARTSDQLANSQRKLNAELDNAQAALGTKLLPAQLAVTKAQIDLINALNDGAPQKALAGFNALAGTLAGPFRDVVDQRRRDIVDLGVQLGLAGKHADDMVGPVQGAGKAIDDLGGRTHRSVPAFQAAAGGLDKWTEQAYLAGIQADKAAPKITNFFDRFSIAMGKGDIAQTKLNLMDDRKAIADIVAQMDKATPGTSAYKKLQLELAVAQGKLAGDTQALREEQAKLFLLKPSKTGDFKKWTDSLGLDVNNLYGDVKLAYDELQKLLKINVSAPQTLDNTKPPPGSKPKKNAEGGWVGLNGPELSWVGEKGPEYIIPNNKLGKGGMGGNSVTVHASFLSMPTAGQVSELARMIDEALYYNLSRAAPVASRA